MSWKPEVQADSTGKWATNAVRFETKEEAEAYLKDLFSRWIAVRDTRIVECDDPVTYKWDLATGKATYAGGYKL
jgi:hypothetical protein